MRGEDGAHVVSCLSFARGIGGGRLADAAAGRPARRRLANRARP
ncbi:flagellar hook capping protein [Burkholderia pseudomallei]|nr:flagellar hook capping protein [Burkholderia pseudomallei]